MRFWDITNGITVSYLLLLAFFLIWKSRLKIRSHSILAIFLLIQSSCILNSFLWRFYSIAHERVPYLFYIADTILYLWGPALYMYIKSYTNPDFRLSSKNMLHLVPFMIHGIMMVIAFHHFSAATKTYLLEKGVFNHVQELVIYVAFHFQMFMYLFFSCLRVREFRRKIKQEMPPAFKAYQDWIIFVLLGFLAIWLFDVSFRMVHLLTGYSYFPINIIYLLVFILAFNIMMKGLNNPMIFGYQKSALRGKYFGSNLKTDEKNNIYDNILKAMREKNLYREPSLTIADLAKELSILPKHLSQVINEYFEMNFFDFINEYRIKEVKSHLSESEEAKKTILEILYDAGFNSKSSFNKAFRKSTGITPTEYRKRLHTRMA